jgi:hypothetical protein
MKKTKTGKFPGAKESAEVPGPDGRAKSLAIESPAKVLAAAELAVPVFNMAIYYRSVRLMREKGYSWRELADWLKQFRIEVSYAHLRRLFIAENKRLSKLTFEQLRAMGMPSEMAKEIIEKEDPVNRLPAADPGDEEEETEP